MKHSFFARLARAFFIFWHFEDVVVLSTTWNDLFCNCVDDVSIWWQMLNFVFLCPKRWFQFNSRIVRTHFSSIMTLNNWKMIAETRSYIFRWRSRFRRRRVCLTSLLILPYERPTGRGLTWQTIRLAIEGRHCMEPASWTLFPINIQFSHFLSVVQLPFDNWHSSFSATTFFEIAVYKYIPYSISSHHMMLLFEGPNGVVALTVDV